ncbi:MAG: ABC transporter ATP-binding protein [Hyphomicrobiales bacterium]|nr:ABC transporter ATP-binding protein [Hyphomicrobiales bacterium]
MADRDTTPPRSDGAPSPAPLLVVRNLRVTLPTLGGDLHAVRGVDLSVRAGETFGIVGESGCGKSLTSLALMNLLPRHARRGADRIEFAGQDLQALGERQMGDLRGNSMSMVFQQPMSCLNPAYTIGNQLVSVFRRHRKVGRSEATERAVYLLDKVGITGGRRRLGQYPHQLSGGLRQRVMIAMALMCEPDLIIADEPTTALDVTIQAQILHLLAELQQEFGMSIILITHDLGIVARIANRVAVMYAGEFVEVGSVDQLYSDPRHPYTRGLFDCIPQPGKTPPGARLGFIPGIVPSLFGKTAGCAFATRCAKAGDACRDAPPWHGDADGHEVRCHFAGAGPNPTAAPPSQGT